MTTDHVSHFIWSSKVEEAVGTSGTTTGNTLFTNETGFKVNVENKEQTGWHTLSSEEWQYLFSHNKYKWATVNGIHGFVIAPDDFTETLSDSYANDEALKSAGNLVFLPAAGYRAQHPTSGKYEECTSLGYIVGYWSSTPVQITSMEENAYYVYYNDVDTKTLDPDAIDSRKKGHSIRLVTECE